MHVQLNCSSAQALVHSRLEVQHSTDVGLPVVGEVQLQQSHSNSEPKQAVVLINAHCAHGHAGVEERGNGVQPVVEELSEWRTESDAAGLLAVHTVQRLVEEHSQGTGPEHPLRGLPGGAVCGGTRVGTCT